MNKWIAGVISDGGVVLVAAETTRSLEEGTAPVPRVGVIYEAGTNKKSGLPYVRMLVTHEKGEEGTYTELEEPKFRTLSAESMLGFTHRRLPHLEPKDPKDYMKNPG